MNRDKMTRWDTSPDEVIFYVIPHEDLRHQRTVKMARRRCAVYHE